MVNKEMLKDVEGKVRDTISGCKDIQFDIRGRIVGEELVMEVKVKALKGSNVCPNYSNSEMDCVCCEFGSGWHFLEGRCVPREGGVELMDYRKLPLNRGDLPKVKRGKGKKKVNKESVQTIADAVWV